jgi:hypothetical protein
MNSIPIKIKKNHNKKFIKNNHHKTYNNIPWCWIDIFNELEELKLECVKFLNVTSIKYGINKNVLKRRYHIWIKNGKPNNLDHYIFQDKRGGYNKIFIVEQERELFIYIKNTFIDKYLPLCNEDIKLIAVKKWVELNPNSKYLFKASNGWCTDFKKNRDYQH